MSNIATWMGPGGHHPEFVSVNEQDNGDVIISVRSKAPFNGNSGSVAECRLTSQQYNVLLRKMKENSRA